ncbi:MAG TPA: CBS domain-containing protein [Candidatus Dormibacteraeota bacterium]
MSPRAAARLEQLGFAEVYDYEGGKMDWLDHELPAEGEGGPLVSDAYDRDVPTCAPEDPIGRVRELLTEGWAWAVVVNSDGVVLGRLRRSRLGEDLDALAGDLMELGPSTYRPSVPLAELVPKMKSGGFERALVTDPDGRLCGLLNRAAAEAALNGYQK